MRITVVLFACLASAGCATVTRGTSNQVQIVSEPSGAQARTSLGHACTTPCTLTIGRKDEFSVVYAMPGYEEARVDVKTNIAGAGAAGFAGNIIAGGVIGMGVDAATGSTLEHTPNPVFATLRPTAPVAAPPRAPRPRARKPRASAPAV